MTKQTEPKIIATFNALLPARIIEQDSKRTLETREGGKSYWRPATESEALLILGASARAKRLLEGKADVPSKK